MSKKAQKKLTQAKITTFTVCNVHIKCWLDFIMKIVVLFKPKHDA